MSAFFQSVLTDVVWGDLAGSHFLAALQGASTNQLLSIKFNVDGFDGGTRRGRIVGTIGAVNAGEPNHFIRGRHCTPEPAAPPRVWYFPAVVDAARGKLVADFGNALRTTSPGGPVDATLGLEVGLLSGNQFSSLGRIPINGNDWYRKTAGICEFPADRTLSAAELAQLQVTPIAVRGQTPNGPAILAREGADGLHVRADSFVYRMSANDQAGVTIYAGRFGQPLASADIDIVLDGSGLQSPEPNVPPGGVTFAASVATDARGTASLTLEAHSIGQPRPFIDGQVYGVGYKLRGAAYSNPFNFISILLWTDYQAPSQPTWHQDVQPIFAQYAKLYPVMRERGIIDLGIYDDVVDQKGEIRAVFSRPESDPRYMPVTRDLSPAKRSMLLSWLDTTGNGGKPNLGQPPSGQMMAGSAATVDADSKTRALLRRKDPTA